MYEQKYLKYKMKYLELKNNLIGGVKKTLYYQRIGIGGINGDLRVGQEIGFKGNIYDYPINPDLPDRNKIIGSANISYIIKNLTHDDALVDIKLELSYNDKKFIFEKKDVEIRNFKVIDGNLLSKYKLVTLLDSVTNPEEKLEYKIDSYVRFGQHTGEFTINFLGNLEKTFYYERIGIGGIEGNLKVGQEIGFKGNIYNYPINPDRPDISKIIGSSNITYTIKNLTLDYALVDIKLELSYEDYKNLIFEKKNVKIKDFNVIEGNILSKYKVTTLLDSVTNPEKKLEYKIDNYVRFGVHTGEFRLYQ
jgi:hypothetical protein